MSGTWKTLQFGEFLKPNLRPFLLAPDQDANLVGMRWYGEGPFHRELKLATKIAKKSHFVIRAGDVIYNKLFAWKGTFGIVPSELDGMFVSDKFPTYELDREQVSDKFLRWYFRFSPLWDQARAKSTGSAAVSKLTLNPPRFLDLTLRAPELVKDQDTVADRLDDLASKLGDVRAVKAAAEFELKALTQVIVTETLSTFTPDGTLRRVLRGRPRNGWSVKCDNAEGGTAVLALGAVTGFHYDATEIKHTSEPVDPSADYWLTPGDLLMTRSNTPELVGHAAIFDGNPYPCIYPDLMMLLDVDETLVDKKFVWYWLQSTPVRQLVQNKAKGTSPTMKKISQRIVEAIPFPNSLRREEWTTALRVLDERLAMVRNMKTAATLWADDVSPIMPAVLYETFQ